ncbi:hypothetical protein MMC11_007480, partial [Xylographa trunciseda]|nr:hypothetical protein [Xylographa trunciseda]
MAHSLGLQRDSSHFDYLTPYEVEIRPRVWWSVCKLDLQASEDQGIELTITWGSFDTKLPLNINDADIEPQTKQMLIGRQGLTDMTFSVVTSEICVVIQRLMTPATEGGGTGPGDQHHLLNDIYERLNRSYLQYLTGSENIIYWIMAIFTRLPVAKRHLLSASLLSSPPPVAEYNHTLYSAEDCRQWRWIFQTSGHWRAVVYLLIEIGRRPWSPIVERAWVALHSSWVIAVRPKADKNQRMWLPLRKLIAKARKHREVELDRLRGDARAVAQLEIDDGKIPLPASSGPFSAGKSSGLFRQRWRKLSAMPEEEGNGTHPQGTPATATAATPTVAHPINAPQQGLDSGPVYGERELWSKSNFEPAYLTGQDLSNTNPPQNSLMATDPLGEVPLGQTVDLSYDALPADPLDWLGGESVGSGVMPWLWGDVDPPLDVSTKADVNMDLDTD